MSLVNEDEEDRSSIGRQISFWMRHDAIDKLQRMADRNGITRNAMMTQLVNDAEDA